MAKDWREPPRPIVYQATLSNFDFQKPVDSERFTSGKGLTDRDSERGAIVEALERYCAWQRRPDAMVFGARSSLEGPSIAPEEFVLYSDRQYDSVGFPHRRPVADEEFTWVRGCLLDSGEVVYAPASLIYMNFLGAGGREQLTFPNSNGLAGGVDLPSAVLAGVYELIERDAFIITWLTRLPAPRIDFAESCGVASEIRRHYARFEIDTVAFDLTTDLDVPVVMAAAFDRSGHARRSPLVSGAISTRRPLWTGLPWRSSRCAPGLGPRFRQQRPPLALNRYEDVRRSRIMRCSRRTPKTFASSTSSSMGVPLESLRRCPTTAAAT